MIDSARLSAAYTSVSDQLLDACLDGGHWEGRLSSSALSTATAISALSFYVQSNGGSLEETCQQLELIQSQIDQGIAWLMTQQNSDGGWGDTSQNYSNISTSMLVVAAIHAAKRDSEFGVQLADAQAYIDSCGGISGLRKRYGKDKTFAVPILANCAMAGIVPWKEVSALPFEAACVPQRFYNLMQLPVVSYAIPALVAIGQAKFKGDPPWDPIRKMIRAACIKPSLKVLDRMQPSTGGFLEAVPLTSFVAMGLIKSGQADHPVVENGIRFILDSFRVEEVNDAEVESRPFDLQGDVNRGDAIPDFGSWPIDTNLATWNTTLSVNAIANHTADFKSRIESDSDSWQRCLDWIVGCQNITIHPFTGAEPGGWGWSDLSGAVPDADDTPGALLALKKLQTAFDSSIESDDKAKLAGSQKELAAKKLADVNTQIHSSAKFGVQWLINLQNRDKGWPTFCRGWGKLPFDRSGSDITAHAIRGLLAWQQEFDSSKLKEAIRTGFGYIQRQQQADGSWLPLWFGNQDQPDDINPCYGTAKVLMAYREANSFDTKEAAFGLRWLADNQNLDGGWGGGPSVQWDDERLGHSSVEETSLCTEVLIDDPCERSQAAAQRGIEWLMVAVESNQIAKHTPIGFYFAKLWYYEELYPLIFATSALGRGLSQQDSDKI